ncbi:hypothetical protein FACS1894113_5280 [Alphaproteobacteria bacterium]|nr:hypothetical protein FACS1894113_5280 [Alphaproteobacteria bacterium]
MIKANEIESFAADMTQIISEINELQNGAPIKANIPAKKIYLNSFEFIPSFLKSEIDLVL